MKTGVTKRQFIIRGRKYALMVHKGALVGFQGYIWAPLFWRINKRVESVRDSKTMYEGCYENYTDKRDFK